MPDFTDCSVIHYFRSERVVAQIGYDVVIAPSTQDLTRTARRLHRALGSRLYPSMSISWGLVSTITRSGRFAGRHDQLMAGTVPTAGSICSAALLVSKIPVIGAGGRMYIPGVAETQVQVGGQLAPNVQNNLQDDVDNWFDRIQNRGYQMVMRRPDGTLDPMVRLRVRPFVGRQDRRLIRSRF